MRKEREKKKQVSGVATANSLDNCEQTEFTAYKLQHVTVGLKVSAAHAINTKQC